jgi:prolyl-tRNA synthetase
MKVSQLFTRTQKQAPTDEVAKNAQLLIRAGFVHKEMAGVYAYTPLGLRVLENIKQIVREEMNAIGGQEVMMTALQPRELWEKTDRWDDAKVDNWFKTKLNNGAELGVGLTHEEPIVDLLSDYIKSYKDLPMFVYQIQTKFRNELRAKSGLLRGREFIMKDMYSLARTQSEHDELYEQAATAYHRVYERLGLGDITFRVKADGGIFTERFSDEFQTITPVGEDTLFRVPGTDEFYNEEVAPALAPKVTQNEQSKPMEEVVGKGIVGVQDLAKFLKIPVELTTKTMLYQADDGRIVAAAVRGGYDVNEIKLRKVVDAKTLKLADEETVRRVTQAEVGYAGLLNLPEEVTIVVDESCANRVNFEMGGNKTDTHNINVNWGVDLPEPEQFHDIKVARPGDIHPDSGKVYEHMRAVEVGNIFPLETKYTDALGVYFTDETGKQQSIIMGCYGIGVSRLIGTIAEHFSDEKGLVWSDSVAPFRVYMAQIGDVAEAAQALYDQLVGAGVSVLWDDRDTRPGDKFADADLMGLPHRIVISPKTVELHQIEYKSRTSDKVEMLSTEELIKRLS